MARPEGVSGDEGRYKRLQHEVQYQIRFAHKTYMQEAVSKILKDNQKKFWSIIKNKGREATGACLLILNDQFVLAFTEEDTSSLPDKGPSPISIDARHQGKVEKSPLSHEKTEAN